MLCGIASVIRRKMRRYRAAKVALGESLTPAIRITSDPVLSCR